MEQGNRAAANTRRRHTDWHALWSSSYAGAWCTPCSKGTFPLVNPLRGNIPLVGVHFSALLAPVTVLLYGAKTWQLYPVELAIAQEHHLRPLRDQLEHQLNQGDVQVFGKMPLGTLAHPPGERQGTPLIDHVH